jgi:hypothetical protein
MRKHIKPADLHPKAGDRITLTLTRVVQVTNPAPSASPPRPGKLNYLSKPKKSNPKPTQSALLTRQRITHHTYSQGRYFGNGHNITAFVWLDDEAATIKQ